MKAFKQLYNFIKVGFFPNKWEENFSRVTKERIKMERKILSPWVAELFMDAFVKCDIHKNDYYEDNGVTGFKVSIFSLLEFMPPVIVRIYGLSKLQDRVHVALDTNNPYYSFYK